MRPLTFVTAAAVAAATLAPAAHAAPPKPKPFSKTVSVTDNTPDPTAGGIRTKDICIGGMVPHEDGFIVKIPGPGKLKADLEGFTGDWGMAMTDASGKTTLSTSDGEGPQDAEGVSYKTKKAITVKIFACNLEATPKASVKYSYAPS